MPTNFGIRRIVATRPPGSALGVDRSDPITRGLVALLSPTTGEVIHGGLLNAVSGAASIVGGTIGMRWAFSSTALQAAQVPWFAPPFTCVFVARPGTANTNEALVSFGGAGAGNGWRIGAQTAFAQFGLTYGGVADYSISATGFVNTKVSAYALTAAAALATGYRDGVSVGSVAIGTALTPAQPLTLGAYHDGTSFSGLSSGDIYAVAIWNRLLSLNEIRRVSANPAAFWQAFRPPSRTLWIPTGGATTFNLSAADSAAATDSGSLTETVAVSAADSAAATDAATSAMSVAVDAADSAAATDAATAAMTVAASAADSAAASDAATSAMTVAASASDSAAATDAASLSAAFALSAADSAAASDAASAGITYAAAAADSAAASDAASSAMTVAASASDSAAATDSASETSVAARSAADSVAASDAASPAMVASASASDSAAATDSATAGAAYAAAAADAVAATDSASQSTVFAASAADAVAAGDAATLVATLIASALDAAAAGDSASTQAAFALAAADGVTATDTASLLAILAVQAAESNAASDAATAALQGASAVLSPQHHAWLEALARAHGLIDPLVIDPAASRSDGTLVQSVASAAGATVVTTLAAPTGAVASSSLSAQEAAWLEQLVRLYGVIDPLTVTATGRSDGTLGQTFTVAGPVTTISTP